MRGQVITQSVHVRFADDFRRRIVREEFVVETWRRLQLRRLHGVGGNDVRAVGQFAFAIDDFAELDSQDPKNDAKPPFGLRMKQSNACSAVARHERPDEGAKIVPGALQADILEIAEEPAAAPSQQIACLIVPFQVKMPELIRVDLPVLMAWNVNALFVFLDSFRGFFNPGRVWCLKLTGLGRKKNPDQLNGARGGS